MSDQEKLAEPILKATDEPPAQSQSAKIAPGTVFAGKYEIIELLGQGGMSAVYKAKQILTGQQVALKVMLGAFAANKQAIMRFRQEAQAVSKLNHPHIVRMYDFGISDDGLPYLSMDYIQGRSLAEVIAETKGIPADQSVAILIQVCEALAHAHAKGVIHRDIKPSNIMIDAATDAVKLVDFGIAKLTDEDSETGALTQTGEIFGSPYYMSPEQCTGQKPTARSDVYAVGCLGYEMITGHPPFVGTNVYDTIRLHMEASPASFVATNQKLRGPLYDQLETILLKALVKDADKRLPSMQVFAEQLKSSEKADRIGIFLGKLIRPKLGSGKRDTRLLAIVVAIWSLFMIAVFAMCNSDLTQLLAYRAASVVQNIQDVLTPASSPEEQWRSLIHRGMGYMDKRQFQLAADSLKGAVKVSEGLDYRKRVLSLDQLRVLYRVQGDRKLESETAAQEKRVSQEGWSKLAGEAAMLERAMDMAPAHPSGEQQEKFNALVQDGIKLSNDYQLHNEKWKAAEMLHTLLNRVSASYGSDSALTGSVSLRYALAMQSVDQEDAALTCLKSSLPILQKHSPNSADTALCEADLAYLTARYEDTQTAVKLLDKASADLHNIPESLDLARASDDIGRVLTMSDHLRAAIPLLQKAEKLYLQNDDPADAGRTVQYLAYSMYQMGQHDQARKMLADRIDQLTQQGQQYSPLTPIYYIYLGYEYAAVDPAKAKHCFNTAMQLAQITSRPCEETYMLALEEALRRMTVEQDNAGILALSEQLYAIRSIWQRSDLSKLMEAKERLACAQLSTGYKTQAMPFIEERIKYVSSTPPGRLPEISEWTADLLQSGTTQQQDQFFEAFAQTLKQLDLNSLPANDVVSTKRWLARIYAQCNRRAIAERQYNDLLQYAAQRDASASVRTLVASDLEQLYAMDGKAAESARIRHVRDEIAKGK